MVVVSLRLELLIRIDKGIMRRLMPLIKRRRLSNLKCNFRYLKIQVYDVLFN